MTAFKLQWKKGVIGPQGQGAGNITVCALQKSLPSPWHRSLEGHCNKDANDWATPSTAQGNVLSSRSHGSYKPRPCPHPFEVSKLLEDQYHADHHFWRWFDKNALPNDLWVKGNMWGEKRTYSKLKKQWKCYLSQPAWCCYSRTWKEIYIFTWTCSTKEKR